MFLNEKSTGHMVEVLDITNLFDLYSVHVQGRYHRGEELQDTERFAKSELEFLSGEKLPQCWLNPHYRNHEVCHTFSSRLSSSIASIF